MARQIGDVILEVEDLHTYCFTRFGTVKAVDGVSFNLRQGEALAIVGESGSGKTMTALSLLQLQPRPAARIVKGSIRLEGEDLLKKTEQEMRQIRGRRISMILQDPQTSLNPVFTVGNQLIEAIRNQHPGDGQALARAARDRRPEAGAGRGARPAGRGLPAPDQRRHEAARGRRHRHLLRAEDHHRRRADHLARRDHTGAVPAAAARDPGGNEPVADLHHARLRHRRQDVRPRGGDVCRPPRGKRAGAGDLQQSVASLHPGAAALGAQHGRGRRAALLDRRPAARALGSPRGMPVRPPLPVRRGSLPARISPVVQRQRERSHTHRQLLATGNPHERHTGTAGPGAEEALSRHPGIHMEEARRLGAGRRRHRLLDPAGRDARHRGRVRLRQDDDRQARAAPGGTDRRRRCSPTARTSMRSKATP